MRVVLSKIVLQMVALLMTCSTVLQAPWRFNTSAGKVTEQVSVKLLSRQKYEVFRSMSIYLVQISTAEL